MSKSVIIIGAGGHGKVIADIVQCAGDRVLGFLDDAPCGGAFLGWPVLGQSTDYVNFPDAHFVIGIGNAAIRERMAERMRGIQWYTAIHPKATVSALDTSIGDGTVIMANVVVNPGTKIGRHCIVNTGAVIDHDNQVEDYAHVSVGANLAGTVKIGRRTWVGIGAVVSNNLSVCADCVLGAGAVVVKDITEPGVYTGVPAKRKQM